MKTEKTEMIMKYFDVTYKVAKQYEIILKDKQLRQIKAWYETKKGDDSPIKKAFLVVIDILVYKVEIGLTITINIRLA
jgi:hypothetical protein